jgi:hypothetical protein
MPLEEEEFHMRRSVRVLSAFSCLAVGGASALAAPPLNDNRSAAFALTMGQSAVGNINAEATFEPGSLSTSCGGAAAAGDVWYKVTSAAGTWRVSLCGSSMDTVVQVFANSGSLPGASLGCNDDFCGTGSQLDITNNTSGGTYWIRVAGKNNARGSFALATTFISDPPPPPVEIPSPSLGPDVTIGNLYDIGAYGTTTFNGVAYSGFAVGTDSWNIGDRPAVWISSNNQHPVIGQQMYKLKNGRFEQIGLSWVKHGFLATNSAAFQANMAWPTTTPPFFCTSSGAGGAALGVNCSDLYTSGLNGGRSYLGPRYDINPINGTFTYPWKPLVNNFTPSEGADKASRRIMVKNSDLGDTTARYFVDSTYITPDDAQWNNGRNNYTTREITVPAAGTTSAPGFLTPDIRRTAAIQRWAFVDPTVVLVPVDFTEIVTTVNDTLSNPPGPRTINVQGRFFVASKVTDNGNGTWNYEYAIQNINSHRGIGTVVIPSSGNAVVTAAASVAPMYHSGDRVANNPWIANNGAGYIGWTTDSNYPTTTIIPGAPVASQTVTGVGPNFIRWGALHNYRFTSSKPPVSGSIKLGLSRPPANAQGFQGSILVVPGVLVPTPCLADIAGPGQSVGGNGDLTADDIIVFLNAFFAGNLFASDVAGAGQSLTPDNDLTADDIIVFLNSFFAGC